MNDTPGIAERYSSACRSSNLRVETNRGSSADVLIAAGWSRSSMGTALMRLQGEWDAAEKPRMPKQE